MIKITVANNTLTVLDTVSTNKMVTRAADYLIKIFNNIDYYDNNSSVRTILLYNKNSGSIFTHIDADTLDPDSTNYDSDLDVYSVNLCLLLSNANTSLIGDIISFKGVWNASTNIPHISSGIGMKGSLYKVAIAGNTMVDGINTWNVGDQLSFNGIKWERIPSLGTNVLSINGKIGAVDLIGTNDRLDIKENIFDIAQNYKGQSSIDTLGNITTGTWSANPIQDNKIASSDIWNNKISLNSLYATEPIIYNNEIGRFDLNIIQGTHGGTGIDNGSKTIRLGGDLITTSELTINTIDKTVLTFDKDFIFKGLGDLTINTTASTNITLPLSGTLLTEETAFVNGGNIFGQSSFIGTRDDFPFMIGTNNIPYYSVFNGVHTFIGDINIGQDIGMKIGVSDTQKIGFFGSNPVIKQSNISDIGDVLSNLGFRNEGSNYSIKTNNTVYLTGETSITHLTGNSEIPNIEGFNNTASIIGTDISGTISITTSDITEGNNSVLTTITFNKPYTKAPNICITANSATLTQLSNTQNVYVVSDNTSFSIMSGQYGLEPNTTYKWFYIVVE